MDDDGDGDYDDDDPDDDYGDFSFFAVIRNSLKYVNGALSISELP
jgi:hypothetical protein